MTNDDKHEDDGYPALARLTLELTGTRTPGEAAAELRRRSRVVAELEQREEAVVRERAAIDASERCRLVATMVVRGHEPPATAWARTVDGAPDATRPAEPWASMPLAELRERVARSAGPSSLLMRVAPPTSDAAELSDVERAMLAKKQVDPEAYKRTKAAIAAKARATPARKRT